MQTPGVSSVVSPHYSISPPTAAQISEAATFAEKLAAAVAREREEKAAIVERAKAQYQEYLDYQAQKAAEPAADEAAAETAKTEGSGLNALFGDNTQSALMMMLAMMASGGGGGMSGLYGDSSTAQSLTGTSATTEMLMRVVPALMQLSETESRNKQSGAAAAAANQEETSESISNL